MCFQGALSAISYSLQFTSLVFSGFGLSVSKKLQKSLIADFCFPVSCKKLQKKVTLKLAKAEKGSTFAPAITAKFISKS